MIVELSMTKKEWDSAKEDMAKYGAAKLLVFRDGAVIKASMDAPLSDEQTVCPSTIPLPFE